MWYVILLSHPRMVSILDAMAKLYQLFFFLYMLFDFATVNNP